MSEPIANVIAPQIPYLRRFARALCGSQDSGDNHVAATLEALVADRSMFDTSLSPRVALYKAFVTMWSALPMNRETVSASSGIATAADRRIETLTPLPRQAFLLTAMEEFSQKDVASILGLPETHVSELISRAGREISEQIAAKVMIIEDEPMIALDIETLVTDIGHSVVGVAATRTEAVALAAEKKPEIILSDIQLADNSSGIDAVNDILKIINVPVIFITAYPERLLTGERAEPTYLITKPFQPELVKAVISQALFFNEKGSAPI